MEAKIPVKISPKTKKRLLVGGVAVAVVGAVNKYGKLKKTDKYDPQTELGV